jgi:two-component sensor histidine kinase
MLREIHHRVKNNLQGTSKNSPQSSKTLLEFPNEQGNEKQAARLI